MTNWNLGASEVQATHQRNIGGDEIHIGALPQHLIIVFTNPLEMNVRCEGVKRNAPPPVGSIALVPVGAVAHVSWRGNKDCLQVSVETAVSWPFGEAIFNIEYDIMSDTTKSRRYGFLEWVDTEEMLFRLFTKFQKMRFIPSLANGR